MAHLAGGGGVSFRRGEFGKAEAPVGKSGCPFQVLLEKSWLILPGEATLRLRAARKQTELA